MVDEIYSGDLYKISGHSYQPKGHVRAYECQCDDSSYLWTALQWLQPAWIPMLGKKDKRQVSILYLSYEKNYLYI